jgi:hypothetical protein
MLIVGLALRSFRVHPVVTAIVVGVLWFGGFVLSAYAGYLAALGGGMSDDGYRDLSNEVWAGFWLSSFYLGLFLASAYSGRSLAITSGVVLLSLSALAVASWVPSSGFALDYARRNPEWAWLHGGPEMQRVAGPLVAEKVLEGGTMSNGVRMLDRCRHPQERARTFADHSVALFYVRDSPADAGIRIEYKDDKILYSSFFRNYEELAEQGGGGQPATRSESK